MINADRLNSIRAFVQAAQAGGFSQAAYQLGLSRSTVGKAVARLEARLQVKLFQRTTRSLSRSPVKVKCFIRTVCRYSPASMPQKTV